MTRRWGLLASTLLVSLAVLPAAEPSNPGSQYVHPELLVGTEWLDQNIIRPEILLVDLRSRDVFDQGHIPGSYWLDEARLVKRDATVISPAPADEFKALMESVGIGEGVHVVVVDDIGGKSAARLWWTLGYYGFDNVSILDGGYSKWESEGRASTYEYPFHRTATFTPGARPERMASAEAVRDWKSAHAGGVILDARSRAEYEGTSLRRGRPGHIPGAVNLSWDEAFGVQNDVRVFKPAPEILALLNKAGVTKDSKVVVYCHDNRRASHLLFTMALMGFQGSNYVGGWAEWSTRADLPVEAPKEPAKAPPSKAPEGAKPKPAGTPPIPH